MKTGTEGDRWRKLDNTAKIFPVIANEKLSNVFRISVTLNHSIVPELLGRALEEVLPEFDGYKVKLRRGFFWYYFETNKRTPVVEKEEFYPCKYIDPHSSQLYQFRVSYFQCRINLEMFHAMTDGLGAVSFLKAIACRYLDLCRENGAESDKQQRKKEEGPLNVEDSYVKHFSGTGRKKYSSIRAYQFQGQYLPLDAESVVHGYIDVQQLKMAGKAHKVSVTKYLTAAMIWSVYQEYLEGEITGERVGISLPVNLRAFFDSETMANFFAVTMIDFMFQNQTHTFKEVLLEVSRQMDSKIVKERLEETIAYNVSNEKKWYVRISPLVLKAAVVNMVFKKNDRAYTMTLSNIGPIQVEKKYEKDIRQFHLLIGVSKRQPVKCGVCAYKDQVVITFTSVFHDLRIQERFFSFLGEQGIPAEVESNGAVGLCYDRGMYPKIVYDMNKWRKLVNIFYALLIATAAVLGVVNYATYNGFLWSGIAIGGIIYAGLTVRYSILHHSNLAFKVVVQTLGAQALLLLIDWVIGYSGWSVDFAIPSTILFADIAMMFLIIVNRLNWQSYLMYQIAITIFSLLPLVLWAAGWLSNPVMAVITSIITVFLLGMTILMGDKSVKNELIKRFHL